MFSKKEFAIVRHMKFIYKTNFMLSWVAHEKQLYPREQDKQAIREQTNEERLQQKKKEKNALEQPPVKPSNDFTIDCSKAVLWLSNCSRLILI